MHERLLAFDFGSRRIGVAAGNALLNTAQPLRSLSADGASAARFERIGALIAEWQPDALVVGVPLHPDGAEHAVTQQARRFARQLEGRFKLPVHQVDERYSSVEAQARGARDIDAEAACIILQQYLDNVKTTSTPALNQGAAC
jgi:putative holliday junction resolvase